MKRVIQDPKSGRFVKHRKPNICKLGECNQPVRGRGYCNKHYLRLTRYGNPYFIKKRPNGEGGFSRGYKLVTVNGKRVPEHRHIMEQHLGRPLTDNEVVHHIDGNKANNAISNLSLMSRNRHPKIHPESLENLKLGPYCRRGTIN